MKTFQKNPVYLTDRSTKKWTIFQGTITGRLAKKANLEFDGKQLES